MKNKLVIFCILLLYFIFPCFASAKEDVNVYLFHSSSCPHCKSEIQFLKTLDIENVNIKYYEIGDYYKLLYKVSSALDIKTEAVPVTVVGSDYIIGYNDEIKKDILNLINSYQEKEHCDVVYKLENNKEVDECIDKNKNIYDKDNIKSIKIFNKVIKFDIRKVSLPLISIIIGFIDGFNPCAMWILIFLISMLFNMKNRKKMWILGVTFLVSSSLAYLFFMFGIFKLANSVLLGNIFRYIISTVAIIGGLINLNNFRISLKKDTGCTVTNQKSRKKIINRIKNILANQNFLISIFGIIFLSVSVNLVELACSAGLPTLFIEILSINSVSIYEAIIYMSLYILLFMIDDIIIFTVAMVSLKITGISNKFTKYSHLIGGIIMLIIGILMIFKMDWLMFNF